MKISELTQAIEAAAPLHLQEPYDNAGLIVGRPADEVRCALLCVDVTEEIMDEAERTGADIIISHHPLVFHALKKFNGEGFVQRIVERAIRSGIALYACHTNLDAVYGGLSFHAARLLGLEGLTVLSPVDKCSPAEGADREYGEENPTYKDECLPAGFGVTGTLPEPMDPMDFLALLKSSFGLDVIRYSDICHDTVQRIAFCTGSGGNLIETAVKAGAEVYIAADFKYNNFIDADGRIIIADIGHYESEYCAIDLLYDIITKKIPTFAVRKSGNSRNPVNYLV